MENKVFLFIYEHLKLGGIEKNIIEQIIAYSQMRIRIVWLRYGNENDIYEPWIKILEDNNVEIIDVDINSKCLIKCQEIQFENDEIIYATCYEPMDFLRLELISQSYKNSFNMFYIVPHFEGVTNYLEERFYFKTTKRKVEKKLSIIYDRWYTNGSILFFNAKHEQEMSRRYKIDCIDKEKIYKSTLKPKKFDKKLAIKRSKRQEFRIITCGRFEFPHKGYMIGLIDSFVKLKVKYPFLKLDIIGYGVHEEYIKHYINCINTDYKDDITLIGKVSPQELTKYFDNSHLNVSVAGALTEGAYSGLVSLAARHYCNKCEVYGWLNKDSVNMLDSRPGNSVEEYIESLINMDDESYIKLCLESYEYAINTKESDPEWLFKQKNIKPNYYNYNEINYLKKINVFWINKYKIKVKLYNILKRSGVIRLISVLRK